MKRVLFLCSRVSVISALAVLAVSCGVHEQTLHYDRPAALHYLYEAASTKLVRKTHVDIINKVRVNICPASSKIMHPCAWKGHSGKYSVPGEERGEMKKRMGKYLDDAIDDYLR